MEQKHLPHTLFNDKDFEFLMLIKKKSGLNWHNFHLKSAKSLQFFEENSEFLAKNSEFLTKNPNFLEEIIEKKGEING